MSQTMHILAIRTLPGEGAQRAAALAAATGLSPVEARSRTTGSLPRVVACYGQRPEAQRVAERLSQAGFSPLLLAGDEVERPADQVAVRSFSLQPEECLLATRDGTQHRLGWSSIAGLLRGTRFSQQVTSETTRGRALDLSRAVATGGLLLTKETRHESTRVQESPEPFLLVYAGAGPAYALRESELLYQGLGPALQPARTANFNLLVAELRRRAPQAVWDDRLVPRAGAAQLLGGVLSPDEHFDVAVTLVARGLRPV